MQSEKPQPLPLSGKEVRDAVLFKVGEALEKSCNLRDSDAYSAFSAEVSIRLKLNDYGREAIDNRDVKIEQGELSGEPESRESQTTIPPAPPNAVRMETGQEVPVKVTEEGRTVIKRVKYAPRQNRPGQFQKKGTPK